MFLPVFFVFLLFGVPSVIAGQAPVIKSNPANLVAVADFPTAGAHASTRGYVYFWSPDGKETQVHVDMTGLPEQGGPFVYHIHDNAVSNNDCETTGLHFNPYGAATDCDSQQDDSFCQVGDLSGKHGWINTTCYQFSFVDPYLDLGDSASRIVGKSVVFHYADMTKFACAPIEWANDEQLATFRGLNLSPVQKRSLYPDEEAPLNKTYATNWTNALKASFESCSQEAGASGVRGVFGLVLGALLGCLL